MQTTQIKSCVKHSIPPKIIPGNQQDTGVREPVSCRYPISLSVAFQRTILSLIRFVKAVAFTIDNNNSWEILNC